MRLKLCLLIAFAWGIRLQLALTATPPSITFEKDRFATSTNERGDALPDFSYCGYLNSQQPIPQVKTKLELKPTGGDDTEAIQQAVDKLLAMPPDDSGWRGALTLSAETFFVSGAIRLYGDHLVLRGSTANGQTTTIVATGHDRRALIQAGGDERKEIRSELTSLDELVQKGAREGCAVLGYVPLGAKSIRVSEPDRFSVDQKVVLQYPSTASWIAALKMDRMPTDDVRGSWLDWKPGAYDQLWQRIVKKIDGDRIELDVPLTSALDPDLAQAMLIPASELDGRWASHLGVENLRLVSYADPTTNPKDEEHAWHALSLDRIQQGWVRGVTVQQFVGSAVVIGRNSRCITVSDCVSAGPVSEHASWRRQTYLTYGQQNLFLRCSAENGRNDFAVGLLTTGPNAFSYCQAIADPDYLLQAHADRQSGPLGPWATGVIFDNVTIESGTLSLTNREASNQGAGWSAANSILWNCVASVVECRQPPTAFNWAVGVWGEFSGDGSWQAMNEFVRPDSLLHFQLSQRSRKELADTVLSHVDCPAPAMRDCKTIVLPPKKINKIEKADPPTLTDPKRLRIENGWFTIGGQIAIGARQTQAWWRGSILPAKVAEFGVGLQRFVPGIDQRFYTDSIDDIADQLQRGGKLVLEQHWGLWYERRRDDHQMVRRASANVWPPFYEQPWARSGQGQAFDGLSKYDLTRFNSWYFDRLEEFAEQADRRGLILMYSMYFQHNILEAGAHWADFPWRPANCLQATGFAEPPTYENRKRIFMAEAFYDVSHPVRRELHTLYIRHCLDMLSRHNNVLFQLGEEFTGPKQFAEFWLQTVDQWQRDNDRDVIIVLGTTKDVQDEILADNKLRGVIDAIDMKYWWPTRDGQMYNPKGGLNLAPRQQQREWKQPKDASAESLADGVRKLRLQYPDKAIICSISGSDPWLTLAAGGSLVALPATTDADMLKLLVDCQPSTASVISPQPLGLTNKKGQRLEVHKSPQSQSKFVEIDPSTGLPSVSAERGHKLPYRIYLKK